MCFLSGCAGSFFEQLAKDNASLCAYWTGFYGAGAVAPGPAVPVAGVYLHNRLCRSNQPGSEIGVKSDGTIVITHGVYKQDVERKKLQELEEKVSAYERALKMLLAPKAQEEKAEDPSTGSGRAEPKASQL